MVASIARSCPTMYRFKPWRIKSTSGCAKSSFTSSVNRSSGGIRLPTITPPPYRIYIINVLNYPKRSAAQRNLQALFGKRKRLRHETEPQLCLNGEFLENIPKKFFVAYRRRLNNIGTRKEYLGLIDSPVYGSNTQTPYPGIETLEFSGLKPGFG